MHTFLAAAGLVPPCGRGSSWSARSRLAHRRRPARRRHRRHHHPHPLTTITSTHAGIAPRPAPQAPTVPIANETRLIEPDTLGTAIQAHKLSFLQGPMLPPIQGQAVVTCLEIRWPRASGFSGPAPSRYRQPRAKRSATECKHGRGLSALAGTPNADWVFAGTEQGRAIRSAHIACFCTAASA